MMNELRQRNIQDANLDCHDEKDELSALRTLLRKLLTKKYNDSHFRRRFLLYSLLVSCLLAYSGYHLYLALRCEGQDLIPAFINVEERAPVYFSETKDVSDIAVNHKQLFRLKYRLDRSKSDSIPLNRRLDDYRPAVCKHKLYKKTDLTISVIIVLNIAPMSVILRLIYGAIDRTNKYNLAEIIIYAQNESLELEKYLEIHRFTKVRVMRSKLKRSLSAARNEAALSARGGVLVFVPEATEFLPGWSEPLLEVMNENPQLLAGLSMDEINPESFVQVEHVPWHLISMPRWDFITAVPLEIPAHEAQRRSSHAYPDAAPIQTPILQFQPWAASREYFLQLGGLDEGMIGSNYQVFGDLLELALRWWNCHGEVVYLPCSKVAPISLLADPSYSEAAFTEQMLFNSKRTADRWAGAYLNLYYDEYPEGRNIHSTPSQKFSDVIEEKSCKNMEWYISNVAVDWMFGGKLLKFGSIRVANKDICVDNMGHDGRYSPGRPGFYGCHGGFTQHWVMIAATKQIQTETGKCLLSDEVEHDLLTLDYCKESGNQWRWEGESGNVGYLVHKGLCLEYRSENNLLFTAKCTKLWNQKFNFEVIDRSKIKKM